MVWNLVVILVLFVLFCFRKQIMGWMRFLGDVATGFSDEYNSAYLEPDDEDEPHDKNKSD
jgi:Sec-independent protein translocase protein TatA